MARLSWNQDLNRKYEFGVDQGVIYPEDGLAAPWNGIISIKEVSSSEVSPYYFDGVKYIDKQANSFYQITMVTISSPKEFGEALGHVAIAPGFILTKQKKSKFGLSYRTKIGDDLGYKIHLVYNAIVKSSNIVHSTISEESNIETRSWTVDTTPLSYPGLSPSAHIIFDSTKIAPEALSYLEAILYGDENTTPRMPTSFELSNIFEVWEPYSITYSASGISSLVPEVENIDLVALKTNGLLAPIQTTRFGLTSDPGIYRLES